MKNNNNEKPRVDFTTWSDQAERYLRRGIIILVLLLCLSQLILQFPSARHWLTSTDGAEGVPFSEVTH